MLYVDTSAVVKLYVQEGDSRKVSDWLKKNDEAIPWTAFHELEFNHAIHLKEFRGEISPVETRMIKVSFAAQLLEADKFFTFDERQSKLAILERMTLIHTS